MTDDEHRREVLGCLTRLLKDVAHGAKPEQALCTHVAASVGGCAAVHVARDRCAGSGVRPWSREARPDVVPAAARHPYATASDHETQTAGDHDTVRLIAGRATPRPMPLYDLPPDAEVAQVPLCGSHGHHSLLVASDRAFSAPHLRLLQLAQAPLAAFDCAAHAGRLGPAAAAAGTAADRRRDDDPALTRREAEVLKMLADGLLARTIATRLNVSPRTVHKHLGSVYRKLEAHDRLVAVNRAQAMGLLPGRMRTSPE